MLKKLHNTLTPSPHSPPAFTHAAYGIRAHGEVLGLYLGPKEGPTPFMTVGGRQGPLLGAVSGHSATEASGLLSLSKGSGPFKWVPIEYKLETFKRSNQDTIYTQKPSVFEGDWVQSGELLTDCASSVGGELALGQNLLIAYMPWEGYNFEDAILISERLVIDDLYTSVHIERYEIETHKTKYGNEEITRDIPDVSEKQIEHLDSYGVVKLGSWVEEGDILVGKITPMNKKAISPYQKLLYTILEKQVRPFRDTSLRAPKGIKAKVIDIKYFLNPEGVKPPRKELSKNQKLTPSGVEKQLDGRSKTSPTLGKALRRGTSLKKPVIKSPLRAPSGLWPEGIPNPPKGDGEKTPPPGLGQGWERQSLRDPGGPGPLAVSFFRKISSFPNKKIIGNQKSLPHFNPSSGGAHPTAPRESGASFGPPFKKRPLAWGDPQSPTPLWGMGPGPDPGCFAGGALPRLTHLKRVTPVKAFGQGGPGKNFQKFLLKLNKFYSSLSFKRKFNHKKSSSRQEILFCKKTGINPFVSGRKKDSILNNLETIHIYLAEKRKIQVGDKMAGRHGNKGIVSQILPIIDMPYLPDGTPIDMVLNPLGVPSRMNVGQIYECLLGLAGNYLGENYKVIAFDEVYGPEASRSFVFNKLYEARRKTGKEWLFDPYSPGKMRIYDGRTGDCFDQTVTVGHAYIIRLVHMVDDKIHMRSTGPYSLVTQQPLRGRSKQGGQRLGEMEVWAIEGYGAAFTLLEMLTIKSDDMTGRMTLWSNLILNKEISIGTPESFKVLICELQALCMDIGLFRYNKSNDNFYSGDMDRGDKLQPSNQTNLNTLTEINNLISLP